MTDIEGRSAVVTGGASGIGRGIAEALLAAGARVVIADIERDALEATGREIGAETFVVDVTDPGSVQRLAEFTLATFGRVDIVVNNAGVGSFGRISDLTLADWKWMLDVNLWGVIHGVTAFLPLLRGNPEGGHVVNTASMAAFMPPVGLGPYAVSKFGIAALSEVLADELAEDGVPVHVTLLAPGTVHTNIGTSQRNRPGERGALVDLEVSEGPGAGMRWIHPRTVGEVVVRAIRNNDRYALTHPDWWPPVAARFAAIEAAFEKYPILEEGEPS